MNDFDFPSFDEIVTPARKLLERDIQKACVVWARARGWYARKFASPANRSVPDYLFGKDGCTVFVEFKRPGGKVTEAQKEEHKAMLKVGLVAHIFDNIELFKKNFRHWETQLGSFKRLTA